VIINVKIIPKSSKIEVIKVDESNYKIKLTEAPEKGKANEQCISVLAEYFRIKKQNIRIIRGLHSRTKRIEIEDERRNVNRS